MFTEPYLANVTIFAGNFAPRSWMFCQGQLLSIAQNTALFALIGTTYGGDGQTTFALPDFRGRIAVHPGNTMILGEMAGTENVTITSNQMPAHNHIITSATPTVPASSAAGGNVPTGALPAKPASDLYSASADGFGMAATDTSGPSPAAGGSMPVPVISPYLAMNYIIAVEGIFPSRN